MSLLPLLSPKARSSVLVYSNEETDGHSESVALRTIDVFYALLRMP
ncbi:hypothetical protein [Vibrio brasiliensis]